MTLYRRYLFPLLRQFDPERIHDLTLDTLALAQRWSRGRQLLRQIAGEIPSHPVELFGLTFPNVLGVAAGFDKEAKVAQGLALLGFGHVEVGTLTPYPQSGNPRPRIFRLPPDRALINRMGFPNQGVAQALPRLRVLATQPRDWVLGVSLGKQKTTPLAQAAGDYLAVMAAVYPYADYLAVNVSSPNTPGLRELQGSRYLAQLLDRLLAAREALADQEGVLPRPLLLKIAPDLTRADVDQIVDVALESGVDGMIATNTTIARTGLAHPRRAEQGGLSGAPLARRSNEMIAYIHGRVGSRLPLIGVGGVFSVADLCAKLAAGASLVQVYTGLVYEGPGLAGRLLRGVDAEHLDVDAPQMRD